MNVTVILAWRTVILQGRRSMIFEKWSVVSQPEGHFVLDVLSCIFGKLFIEKLCFQLQMQFSPKFAHGFLLFWQQPKREFVLNSQHSRAIDRGADQRKWKASSPFKWLSYVVTKMCHITHLTWFVMPDVSWFRWGIVSKRACCDRGVTKEMKMVRIWCKFGERSFTSSLKESPT